MLPRTVIPQPAVNNTQNLHQLATSLKYNSLNAERLANGKVRVDKASKINIHPDHRRSQHYAKNHEYRNETTANPSTMKPPVVDKENEIHCERGEGVKIMFARSITMAHGHTNYKYVPPAAAKYMLW